MELHTAWADEFKEKHLNQYLQKRYRESEQHCQLVDCQGLKVYAYETAWQGFYLLIHMLQHFVGSGFGLRNLCDWLCCGRVVTMRRRAGSSGKWRVKAVLQNLQQR